MIEILNFSDQKFSDISQQDNPALTHLFEEDPPSNRCIMLVKTSHPKFVGEDGVTVLEIDNPSNTGDRVLNLGHFYNSQDAYLFASSYAWRIHAESCVEEILK